MSEPIKFENLSRGEQKDIFIQQISGSFHEEEILNMLAVFTTYNIDKDKYLEYYSELDTEETIVAMNNGLCGDDWEREDNAWNTVLDSLDSSKIFDLIDNIQNYMQTYLEIIQTVDNMKKFALNLFTGGR